jgi:predicted 3-demethylubiquinone-9 3-methyltransferase (glyoxalase superfamily)
MTKPTRISTCLWFDRDGEHAAQLYVSLFGNSRITAISRYGKGAPLPEGTALLVEFMFDGVPFRALNGGPHFKLTEAVSLSVGCDMQSEIDQLWPALTANGEGGIALRLIEGPLWAFVGNRTIENGRVDDRR